MRSPLLHTTLQSALQDLQPGLHLSQTMNLRPERHARGAKSSQLRKHKGTSLRTKAWFTPLWLLKTLPFPQRSSKLSSQRSGTAGGAGFTPRQPHNEEAGRVDRDMTEADTARETAALTFALANTSQPAHFSGLQGMWCCDLPGAC